MSRIVLASGSPRRKELLEQIGLEFEICPAKGEEVITSSIPSEVVMELSKQKAEEVAAMMKAYQEEHTDLITPTDIMVIGADTVVAYGDEILGKPKDSDDARRILLLLSGKSHSVYTGVTVVFISKEGRVGEHVFYEKTDVNFCELDESEMEAYLAGDEWCDKAGGYGIQGHFARFISGIEGDYYNVMGFPLCRFYQELKKLGIDLEEWK